jgi:PKD domain
MTSGAARGLLRAAVVVLAVIVVGPASVAVAAAPDVLITSPLNGSVSSDQTPLFGGFAEEGGGVVTLQLHQGPTVKGPVVQEMSTALLSLGGAWLLGPAEPLQDATYTAQASQTNAESETGASAQVTFTVDTAAPTVTLNPPSSPADDQTPSFTGTASDTTPVTVLIHAGASPQGTIVSAATAAGTGGAWASGAASPPLAIGQYTAVATQESSLSGNPAGRSAPVTFGVGPAPVATPATASPPAPPVASFKWVPAVPRTGEPVTLISTSTDTGGAIAGFAWDGAGDGAFVAGESTFATSFATPGKHVVRLRVTDASGLSSVVAETIAVSSPALRLMQPFPVVRIAGSFSAQGAKIKLLTVLAPVGATVKVTCRGGGCQTKFQRLLATSRPNSRTGTALIEFHRFERSLRAGAVLDVWIFSRGQVGKFTRFVIRHGKLPSRTDTCLNAAGTTPIACPGS